MGAKLNHGLKQLCKDLYFKYRTLDEIIKQTGVSKSSLKNWVYGRTNSKKDVTTWKAIREEERRAILSDYSERQTHKIGKFQASVVDAVEWSFNQRMSKKDNENNYIPLDLKESIGWTAIAMNFNKMIEVIELDKDTHTDKKDPKFFEQPQIPSGPEFKEAIQIDPFLRKLITGGNTHGSDNQSIQVEGIKAQRDAASDSGDQSEPSRHGESIDSFFEDDDFGD